MLGVTLLAMNAHAGIVDFTLDVKKGQGNKVTFVLNKMDKVDLSIYDAEGILIHSEKVNSQKILNRTYDLKALPEGEYYLVAESELKLARYKISFLGETAELFENPITEEFKPLFMKQKGLVKVNFLNLDQSPIVIKIYDREENLVYDSGVIKDQNIAKVFDIYNIENEEYTIALIDNNKTYKKTFSKL